MTPKHRREFNKLLQRKKIIYYNVAKESMRLQYFRISKGAAMNKMDPNPMLVFTPSHPN